MEFVTLEVICLQRRHEYCTECEKKALCIVRKETEIEAGSSLFIYVELCFMKYLCTKETDLALSNLKFSQLCLRRVLFSGMRRRTVRYCQVLCSPVFFRNAWPPDSERNKQEAECSFRAQNYLHLEDSGITFIRNISELLAE
jgi:hypothetical protein